MSEGVGDGSVNRKVGTNADAHHHKSDLVNFTVTKNTPKIILYNGIKNGKHRHNPPITIKTSAPGNKRASIQTAHFVVKAQSQTGPVGVASAYPS